VTARSLLAAWLIAVPAATATTRVLDDRPCREHPQLVAPCFSIRGRMNYWNGAPSVRIWKVGSRRMLGVSEGRFKVEGYSNLPREITARLTWDVDLFGDFVVCPFTREQPGVMQLMCVDAATNLEARPRRTARLAPITPAVFSASGY
jgi:hypothetical protein